MNRRSSVLRTRGRLPVHVSRRGSVAAGALVVMLGAGCGTEDAIPIDPANPPTLSDGAGLETPDVSHSIEPTVEMQDIARQQCLDDPDKEQGYVQALDPESGEVFAEFTVDCADVRDE